MKTAVLLVPGVALLSFAIPLIASRPARADLYVAEAFPPSIVVFGADAVGDATPVRVIAGPKTGLQFPSGVTVDEVHNELYVSDGGALAVLVFALDASGDVAPLRTLVAGPTSQLGFPRRVTVDLAHDEIMVPGFPFGVLDSTIHVFSRTAAGDAKPQRIISGQPLLENPVEMVLRGEEMLLNSYAAGRPRIAGLVAFKRKAEGSPDPTRIIVGAATGLSSYTNFLTYDAGHDELYADVHDFAHGIATFPGDASGDVAPVRLLSGPSTGELERIDGLVFDATNQRLIIFESNEDDLLQPPIVRVFNRTDSGDTPPLLTISGPHTALTLPVGMDVDSAGLTGLGPQIYRVQSSFEEVIGTSELATEVFGADHPEPEELTICADPLVAGVADACFAADALLTGFTVRSSSGNGVLLAPAGTVRNASAAVGALLPGDAMVIELASPATVISMDVYANDDRRGEGVLVAFHDVQGHMVSFQQVRSPGRSRPAFVGAVSPMPIQRIELVATDGLGVVLIDNLRTTGLAPVSASPGPGPGPSPAPGAGPDPARDPGPDPAPAPDPTPAPGDDPDPAPSAPRDQGGCHAGVTASGAGGSQLVFVAFAALLVRRRFRRTRSSLP